MGNEKWFERGFQVTDLRREIAANFREFALLWLVFSMLDKLIEDALTTAWIAGNCAFGFATWIFGAYLGFRRKDDDA